MIKRIFLTVLTRIIDGISKESVEDLRKLAKGYVLRSLIYIVNYS